MNKAEEYTQAVEKGRKTEVLEYVPMKSNPEFLWGLRRVDLQAWVLTGRLPQSLLEEGMKAWRELGITAGKVPDAEKLMAGMSDKDVLGSMIVMREVVREAAADPRIGDGPGEVLPINVDPRDFMFIFQWATGGAGLDGLRTFRTRQKRGTTSNSPVRKKQRHPRKQAVSG